jgi:hypothetical protein
MGADFTLPVSSRFNLPIMPILSDLIGHERGEIFAERLSCFRIGVGIRIKDSPSHFSISPGYQEFSFYFPCLDPAKPAGGQAQNTNEAPLW